MGGAAGSEGVLCAAPGEEVAARLAGRDPLTVGAAATRRHFSPTYCISSVTFLVLSVYCSSSQGSSSVTIALSLKGVLGGKIHFRGK